MTRSHPRRILVAGLASLAGAACLTTPAFATQPHAKLQTALDRVVAAGAPGAMVLVRDGERTTRLSSGHGELASQTPMRVADRARIGGLTKSFTATVVLQLAAEGRLALGDTVDDRLPGVISNGDAISVRQLLNHTSGIYDYAGDPAYLTPYQQGDLTHVFDLRDGVQIAADHGPLFAPGSGLAYSNTNTILLAMIVEAVTGHTIASELQTRLFEPLRLRHTSFDSSSDIEGSHTHGYVQLDDGPFDVTSWSPSGLGAAGAIVSNADDVARFYRALLRGRLLPAALLKEMQTIDPAATGGLPDAGILGGGWGLGLLRETFPCGPAWGHDSENPGYMTAAWSSKNAARQVVIIVNSNYSHDEPVSRAMRHVLAKAYCDHEDPSRRASTADVPRGYRLTSRIRVFECSGGPGMIDRSSASWSGPATPATVGQARRAVAELAAARGISGSRLDDLRTCVSEAVSNAVLHAFGDGRPGGIITVSAKFSRDALTLVIRDNGIGLQKRPDSPGLGLGLPMIGALSDAMEIVTAAGGGTELSITFTL